MTVKELLAKLEKLPKNLPVYVESAPWGCPFEAEIVRQDTVSENNGKKKRKVVMIEHNVGI